MANEEKIKEIKSGLRKIGVYGINKLINQMRKIIDNNIIDEELNEKLELLQDKLARECRIAWVQKYITAEEQELIMEHVQW